MKKNTPVDDNDRSIPVVTGSFVDISDKFIDCTNIT